MRIIGGFFSGTCLRWSAAAEQLEGQIGPLAVKIMDGLIQSPGHRENILNPNYTHLAIAAVAKGERVMLVQLFRGAPRSAR